jgi:hypothetical protein
VRLRARIQHARDVRPWLCFALVACVVPANEQVVPPRSTGVEPVQCRLAPPYDGKLQLPGVTDRAALDCAATNAGLDERPVCEQVYVGVRRTGALYTSHDPACSSDLAPGASELFTIRLDMPRVLCAGARDCVVRAFALGLDDAPDAVGVIALARELEGQAPEAGRDRPTVRQCDELVERWDGNPGFARYAPFLAQRAQLLLACTELSRADYACLRAARDSTDADRCSPI